MMLLEKTRSRSKRQPKGSPAYLDKIRACPCVLCGAQAEAAHLRMSSAAHGKTNGRVDSWVLPLCPQHHRLDHNSQHGSGERKWWTPQTINPLALAAALWGARSDLKSMEWICRNPALIASKEAGVAP